MQLNGSFPCGKAIGVSRYFLRLAWVLHDSLKVARLNLAATSMGIPVYQWKLLYIDAVLTAISAQENCEVWRAQDPPVTTEVAIR